MKRFAYAAAALLLVVAALALAAPLLLDAPAVRAEIQRRLSAALKGQVSWEALDLALLPSPHGELRGVRVEIPGKLSAAAEELDVYLRLWALLRGDVEISSVSVQKPAVRVTARGAGAQLEIMQAYRAVMEPLARALQEFAPDMVLRLEGAALDVAPLQIRNLNASARTDNRGVAFDGSAASNLWQRVSVEGRVEYADLAARATLTADALAVDRDVPPVALRAKLQTDGTRAIDCEFEGSAAPLLRSAKGKATLPALQGSLEVMDVDLARALDLVQRKGVNLSFIEAPRGQVSAKAQFKLGPPWAADVEVVKSDAALQLAWLPWTLSAQAGRVSITRDRVRVAGARGGVGESTFSSASVDVDVAGKRITAASGRAAVPLGQWLPWLKTKAPLDVIESASGTAEVTLKHLALRFDRPAQVDFDAVATPRDARVTLKMLPDTVTASGGAIRVTRQRVSWETVPVAMLDARGVVSGSARLDGSFDLSVAEGVAGEKLVRWALERGALPERVAPKTPLRFAASRIAWAPKDALRADASLEFPAGPQLGLALAWRPGLLELPRVSIKGAGSDAVLSATVAPELIHARYSGLLQGRSIAAMLREPPPSDSGSVQGELRVVIDRAQPERTSAQGKLRIAALDLTWLAGRKAVIEHADLAASAAGMRIASSRFGWEEQFFELRGEGRRTDQGPVVEARIESAGVDLFRLLPPPDPNAPKKTRSALWPLPVSGRVELRSGYVQYKDYRVEPFDGVVTLERERALVEVKEARVCGLSVPIRLQATPLESELSAQIRMKDEPLERTVRCLTGGDVEITGSADLAADLSTRGRRPHLLRDMTGSARAELRDGRVKKFALLGNILSFRGIDSLGDMKQDGFAYKSMIARGRFENGAFRVDESFFDSDAVRLAAHGRVDLLGPGSQLNVLVGLLTRVDRVAEAVPILGDIFGGSMLALPISVHGDIRDPLIVPLGPRAVTDRLLGIFERTLKLPAKLVPAPQPKP